MAQKTNSYSRTLYLTLIILAGEAVFILPFVLARIFRPTLLTTFDLTNTTLGYCFSVYGIVALISYLFGGVIADRFAPNKLMAVALALTAAGGFYFATIPEYAMLKVLYGYWGFTTIFLFWAAMIKATRVWGGSSNQGKAFGFLDGGRGLVGALFGSLGILIFSLFVNDTLATTDPAESSTAFIYVIQTSSVVILIIAVLVYFFMRLPAQEAENTTKEKITIADVKSVLQLRSVWLLMVIILCAYVGYKITDIFSLYANEVMLYNEVEAAQTGTYLLYIRPLVGVLIGFLADRSRASLYLIFGFGISVLGAIFFASGILQPDMNIFFLLTILITATGVYAARVLYFAVLREGKIPLQLTGTAVGVVSVIGYTPDIFAGPMIGYLLDSSPGRTGHEHVFWMLCGFSVVGLVASWLFYKWSRANSQLEEV